MNRTTANTLSELRSERASWMSLWSFLAHLNDLDFYKGLDEQREICSTPSPAQHGGTSGKQSPPIECVGERFVNFSQKPVEQSGNDVAALPPQRAEDMAAIAACPHQGASRR